jgi:hypothetical protein
VQFFEGDTKVGLVIPLVGFEFVVVSCIFGVKSVLGLQDIESGCCRESEARTEIPIIWCAIEASCPDVKISRLTKMRNAGYEPHGCSEAGSLLATERRDFLCWSHETK